MGNDHVRNVCVNGFVRVLDVLLLQRDYVEIGSEWGVSVEDHVFGRIESSSGGCDELSGSRVTARGASEIVFFNRKCTIGKRSDRTCSSR